MPVLYDRMLRCALGAVAAATLAGCSTFDNATQRMAGAFTPYRVEIIQGNFVSREQVEALKPGMSRQQVREVLGTPLVTSLFHANRWDYVFTMRRSGVESQQRKLAVFFKNEVFERAEGDTMPTEAEFVATLDNRRKAFGKAPPLEASEDKLKEFARKPDAAPAAPAPAAPAASYPPLEPPAR